MKLLKRVRNHASSEKSKSGGAEKTITVPFSPGDIVHVKTEGSKHKAREFYLVTSIDYPSRSAVIQKFLGGTLRNKQYHVKFNEIYLAAANYANNNMSYDDDEEENGITLKDHSNVNEGSTPLSQPLRRSGRVRRQPEWLATDELQRQKWPE